MGCYIVTSQDNDTRLNPSKDSFVIKYYIDLVALLHSEYKNLKASVPFAVLSCRQCFLVVFFFLGNRSECLEFKQEEENNILLPTVQLDCLSQSFW